MESLASSWAFCRLSRALSLIHISGSKGHSVLLCHTDIKKTLRVAVRKKLQAGAILHCSSDGTCLLYTSVKGPEGNIEYLMFVQKSGEPSVLDDSVAEQVVAASHSTLDR